MSFFFGNMATGRFPTSTSNSFAQSLGTKTDKKGDIKLGGDSVVGITGGV